MRIARAVLRALCLPLLLAACGGGGSSTPAPPPPPVSQPATPTLIRVAAFSPNSIELSWSGIASSATAIQIERSHASFPFAPLAAVDPALSGYLDSSLDQNTVYAYRIRVLGTGGVSPWSTTGSATTFLPLPPSNITLSLPATSTNGNYRLGWTVTGIASTSYTIEESPDLSFASVTNYFLNNAVEPYFRDFVGKPAGTWCYRVRFSGSPVASEPATIVVSPPGPTTVVFFATADNTLAWESTQTLGWQNLVVNQGMVQVGGTYASGPFASNFGMKALALQFPQMAAIMGRQIDQATLRLHPAVLPASLGTTYAAHAFAGAWSTNSITWNNAPSYRLTPFARAQLPVTTTMPVEWDVTALVANWANGTWPMHGLVIRDERWSLPGVPLIEETSFESREVYQSFMRRPQLEVTYH